MRRGHACVTLRESNAYAPDAFREGLTRLGYRVTINSASCGPDDVLVVWNRRRGEEHMIRAYEARGARVLVIENGYLGTDENGGKLFAIAHEHHSGAGRWPEGDGSRWDALGIEIAPWRDDGDHILVLGQRSIGEEGVAMPEGWVERTVARLNKATARPVRVRPHPGVARTDPYDDLRGAWAAVTYSSGAGLKALVAGYPVFCEFNDWIAADACSGDLDDIEDTWEGDRLPVFQRMAWAQWSRAEIASGEALARYLG